MCGGEYLHDFLRVFQTTYSINIHKFFSTDNRTITKKETLGLEGFLSNINDTDEGDDLSLEDKERVVEGLALNLQGRGAEVVVYGFLNLPNDSQESTFCFWMKLYHKLPFSNVILNPFIQVYCEYLQPSYLPHESAHLHIVYHCAYRYIQGKRFTIPIYINNTLHKLIQFPLF